MVYEEIFLIGRIIAGLMLFMFGLNHFMKFEMMTQYAASKNVPAPKIAVAFTGLLLWIGAFSILLGAFPIIGLGALVLFFLGVTPLMHNFWALDDEQMKMNEMVQFMKNMVILGLVLSLFIVANSEWPFALTP